MKKMTTFIQGTVKTIDAATQTVALEDGTKQSIMIT